jgi:hypothetical protein
VVHVGDDGDVSDFSLIHIYSGLIFRAKFRNNVLFLLFPINYISVCELFRH